MLQWAIRAALFDSRVYAEIGDDPQSVLRALGIVLVAAIAFALGIRNLAFEGFEGSQAALFLVAMMTVFLSWVAWAAIGYLVGTRIMGGQATYRRMLRALGVAHGPGVLAGFVGTPFVGGTMFALSLLWLLAAGIVAVLGVRRLRRRQGVPRCGSRLVRWAAGPARVCVPACVGRLVPRP